MESKSSPSTQPLSFTRKRYQKHPTHNTISDLSLSSTTDSTDSAISSMISGQNLKPTQLINTYISNNTFKRKSSCKTSEFSLIKEYFFEGSRMNLILNKSIEDSYLKNLEVNEKEEKETKVDDGDLGKIRKIGNLHKKLTIKVNRKERNIDEEVCRSGSSDSTPHLYVNYKERLCGILLSYFS